MTKNNVIQNSDDSVMIVGEGNGISEANCLLLIAQCPLTREIMIQSKKSMAGKS